MSKMRIGRVIFYYAGVGIFLGILSAYIKRILNVTHESWFDPLVGVTIIGTGAVLSKMVFDKMIKSGRFSWFLKE